MRLNVVVEELGKLLGAEDPRWREFGLNLPSAILPEVPNHVSVVQDAPGEFLVTCRPAANATRYRFFARPWKAEAEPAFAGESTEPSFRMTNVTPGKEHEVFVSAANAGAESKFTHGAIGFPRIHQMAAAAAVTAA